MRKKSSKTFIILLVLIFLIVIGFLVVLGLQKRDTGETFLSRGNSLFPFSNRADRQETNENTSTTTDQSGQQETSTTYSDIPRLRKITDFPISGFVALTHTQPYVPTVDLRLTENTQDDMSEDEDSLETPTITEITIPTVRYNKKLNSFIYETELKDNLVQKQLTQTIVRAAHEVIFDPSGDNVAFRYFDDVSKDIETFVARIPEKNLLGDVCKIVFTKDLEKGATTLEGRELQKFLNYSLDIDLVEDGTFGSGTAKSLQEFQNKNNLEESGTLNELTRNTINDQCRSLLQENELAKQEPIELQGGFYPVNISQFVSGPEDELFAYLFDQEDKSFLVTVDRTTNERKQVFDSPFSEWVLQWTNENNMELTTKASSAADGFMYNLNLETGEIERILGDIPGLTTLTSPDGNNVLYSKSVESGLETYVYNKEERLSSLIGITTLPEKCVWKNDNITLYCGVPSFLTRNSYPDVWYKGLLSFSDNIWKIDTSTLSTELIIDLGTEGGETMDVVKPALNPEESHLFFINQNTEELWSLEL